MTALPKWLINASCETDPYLRMAFLNDFADYEPWRLSSPTQSLIAVTFEAKGLSTDSNTFNMPTFGVWGIPISGQSTGFVTGHVSFNDLQNLHNCKDILRVELGLPFITQRPSSRQRQTVTPSVCDTPLLTSQSQALIGVIDHGCPFAHSNLLSSDGKSRLLSIWDQDLQPDFIGGDAPIGFAYGRYVEKSQLDIWIGRAKDNQGNICESVCYELADYAAMSHSYTHGSHVVNVAGGKSRLTATDQYSSYSVGRSLFSDKASESDLVFVQLPRQVAQAPSRGSLTMHLLNGVRYILSCAGEKTKHVIAVVDYGSHLGPHDGSSLFERALDAIVENALTKGIRLDILFPTGNGRKDEFHAGVKTRHAAQQAELYWRIPPCNEVPCFSEIWLRNDSNQPTIHLNSEHEKYQLSVTLDTDKPFDYDHCEVGAIDISRQYGGAVMALLRVAPSKTDSPASIPAPDGRWRLRLASGSTRTSHLYATKGTKNLSLLPRSFKSKFLISYNPVLEFDPEIWIDDLYTTIGPASATKITALASCNAWNGKSTSYSGFGPDRKTASATTAKYLVVGEEAQTLGGIRSYGTRSGISFRLRGSSTAPPQAARHLAQFGRFQHATIFKTSAGETQVAIFKQHGLGWLL